MTERDRPVKKERELKTVDEAVWRAIEEDAKAVRERAERGEPATGHPAIDARSLSLHRIVVGRIDREPNLVRVGIENIERWARQNDGHIARAHDEWKTLVETLPWEGLRELILADSEEGQRIRSSGPFTNLVSENERDRVFALYGIDLTKMRAEYEERTGRPFPRTAEEIREAWGKQSDRDAKHDIR